MRVISRQDYERLKTETAPTQPICLGGREAQGEFLDELERLVARGYCRWIDDTCPCGNEYKLVVTQLGHLAMRCYLMATTTFDL